MIVQIRGILLEKKPPFLVIDVNKIGYELQMPINSFYQLPKIGEEVLLYTHLIIRDDAHSLYGFFDVKQRDLFRALLKVTGIGPKSALAILSGVEPLSFVNLIVEGNESDLQRLPGVGKKTAQRLIMELKDLIGPLQETNFQSNVFSLALREAISALIALGYKPHEAHRAVKLHQDKKLSTEELVRLALRDIKLKEIKKSDE